MRRGRYSRPGPPGWKIAFLDLFPAWTQDAYWHLLDAQRACAIVVSQIKVAEQVNLLKAAGGYRPLTMLEESFKAIEGPVARRRVLARRTVEPGCIYSAANLAGEAGMQAASEVLYTDTLVCETRSPTAVLSLVSLQITKNSIIRWSCVVWTRSTNTGAFPMMPARA